jgi:2-methylcitrate dehydratase
MSPSPVATFDDVTTQLAEYASSFETASLSSEAIHAVVRCMLDAIGCALAGFTGEPSVRARKIAATGSSEAGASVIGLSGLTTPEYAAFANSVMVRYLDMNDTYPGEGGGHASDMIPALLAMAEPGHASGLDVLRATHVAYEVFGSLADAVPLRHYGWDPGTFLQLGATAGISNLLGFDADQTANALSMVITPNMPMSVARSGELSNWKGCATPYATMGAVFAARLAGVGMTGPKRPFDGNSGFFEQVGCGPFSPNAVGEQKNGTWAAQRASFKQFPCDFEIQIPAAVFTELHAAGVRPDDIAAVDIITYHLAWHINGGGNDDHEQKWNPQVRETADHSIPYVIAVALTDGSLTPESFAPERIHDPALRPFMAKISIKPDEKLTSNWVNAPAYDITITMADGAQRHFYIDRPHGHAADPLADHEVQAKFVRNGERRLAESSVDNLCDLLWRLPELPDINTLTQLLRNVG